MNTRVESVIESCDSSLDFLDNLPMLVEGDVHIWSFTFASLGQHLEALQDFFSEYEQCRLKSIRHEPYKNQYIASRGLLRYLLSFYTSIPAHNLCILPTKTGKPELDPHQNLKKIHFNVSHSGEYLLIAFSQGAPIGVDIEYVNDRTDIDSLIPSICSTQEQYDLNIASSAIATRDYFFYLWTRKEALLKNTGEGITVDLSDHDVTLASEKQHPHIVLRSIRAGKGYWMSMAKEGAIDNLYFWVNPNVVAALYKSVSRV